MSRSGLLDRHIGFLESLRGAGVPVSLAEGLDSLDALGSIGWSERETVRAAYAATLVKRQSQRPTFDLLFDLWFPDRMGDGVAATGRAAGDPAEADDDGGEQPDGADEAGAGPEEDTDGGADGPGESVPAARDSAAALQDLRARLATALTDGDRAALPELAAEAVARFGGVPGRGPGLSSWSAYAALRRVTPDELVEQVVHGLQQHTGSEAGTVDADEARRRVARDVGAFTSAAQRDALRRVAEEKGPAQLARTTVRPTTERLDFLTARREDLDAMRREVQPLARRLATRLTQEHHARRRGPVDFRRTVRASVSTGGVPLTVHHRPKRPHRTELVVLCDVSGSVAHFARFTLLLVVALREMFSGLRAFTFVDQVHEVTAQLRPGADPQEVVGELTASAEHAARFGRTNYGRALTRFRDEYGDALGPRSSLLVLGDARSNNSDLAEEVLADLTGRCRHAWWLNPEHARHWDTGDSAAGRYARVVPMVECRNLTQLGEFVHDIL